ncbi:hypothetical protein PMAYCL1PPCAC_14988, partial [Pristionchus mayeri]
STFGMARSSIYSLLLLSIVASTVASFLSDDELYEDTWDRSPYSWMDVEKRGRNPYAWMSGEKRSRNPYSWMAFQKRARNPYSWME